MLRLGQYITHIFLFGRAGCAPHDDIESQLILIIEAKLVMCGAIVMAWPFQPQLFLSLSGIRRDNNAQLTPHSPGSLV